MCLRHGRAAPRAELGGRDVWRTTVRTEALGGPGPKRRTCRRAPATGRGRLVHRKGVTGGPVHRLRHHPRVPSDREDPTDQSENETEEEPVPSEKADKRQDDDHHPPSAGRGGGVLEATGRVDDHDPDEDADYPLADDQGRYGDPREDT